MDNETNIISYVKLANDLEYLKGTHQTLYSIWKQYLLLKQEEYIKIRDQLDSLREKIENNDERIEISQESIQFLYYLTMLQN